MSNKPLNNKRFTGLTKNTFFLAFGSLFADISTEMLYPILPVFLTQNLKVGGSMVGIVEGVAEATQNVVQGISGWLSDKLQKRKPIAIVGYAVAAMSKPLIGLSTSWQGVLGARSLDRLASGTRSAPRDALIASSVDEKNRGRAFGLEGIGDNLGAFIGPILCVFLLFSFNIGIRHIFYLAIIPGALATFMVLLVKEKQANVRAKSKLDINFRAFPRDYWKYLAVIAVFGIGNSSNSFLILQTKSIGVSLENTILIYAAFNLVAALSSYPSGSLSDRYGRKRILLCAILIFLMTYIGFAISVNVIVIGGLFILYGVYQGIFRGVGKAYATDFIKPEMRASGIGWYNTVVGLTGLIASVVAGQLWDKVGHWAVFVYGAVFAVFGSVGLLFLYNKKQTAI